ncbi:MAG TPA: RcnB family protein [Janthinobacterium sp.]|nr:RcnB family protein [Janthinobacterium sp.]
MNKNTLLTAILAACLAVAASASAQEHHDDRDNGHEQAQHHDAPAPKAERGAGPRHDMHKGEHLAPEYKNKKYVVNDWRGHHLSAPPRGYHWVQTGNDYVLVGIASGVIANLLLNN